MFRITFFAIGILLAPTWIMAQTQEPLNNVSTFIIDDFQPIDLEFVSLVLSSDAPFKIDFCATNTNNRPSQLRFMQFQQGLQGHSTWLKNIPKQDTRCVQLGGKVGEFYHVTHDTSGTMDIAVTSTTTATGNVDVGLCEYGGQGPFNCELMNNDCALDSFDLKMFWTSCDSSLDCYEAVDENDGQTYRWLQLPSVGPVVKRGHLVTTAESFGGGWPSSALDGIAAHYAISEDASGYIANRTEIWSPPGEGGSEWGQDATGAKVPVLDEAWYISMYGLNRPAKGTRMIVIDPITERAVVASAGYARGPAANTRIAGVPEEIHHYLGTTHLSDLLVGFASDQTLSLGPVNCP